MKVDGFFHCRIIVKVFECALIDFDIFGYREPCRVMG